MNPVAVTFGVAAVFVLAIACCGPNQLVKVAAAYLFASWLVSNAVFLALTPGETLDVFAYLDLAAASILVVAWLWRSVVWAGLLGAFLYAQVLFNIAHKAGYTTEWQAFFVNDFLFALQLAAVLGSTVLSLIRGEKPRKPRKKVRKARKRAQIALVWDRDAA